MVDLKTTIFIHKIPKNVDGETFISFVRKGGKIKVHDETGRRMAEMDSGQKGLKKGIVTYEHGVSEAIKILKSEKLNGERVWISTAIDELAKEKTFHTPGPYNPAWSFWNNKIICGQFGVGGKGGLGGVSLFGYIFSSMNGKDGEPGEAGKGGKGGEGGSCSVS